MGDVNGTLTTKYILQFASKHLQIGVTVVKNFGTSPVVHMHMCLLKFLLWVFDSVTFSHDTLTTENQFIVHVITHIRKQSKRTIPTKFFIYVKSFARKENVWNWPFKLLCHTRGMWSSNYTDFVWLIEDETQDGGFLWKCENCLNVCL